MPKLIFVQTEDLRPAPEPHALNEKDAKAHLALCQRCLEMFRRGKFDDVFTTLHSSRAFISNVMSNIAKLEARLEALRLN